MPTKKDEQNPSNQAHNESQGTAQGDKNRQVTDAQMDRMSRDTGADLADEPKETVKLYQVPAGSTDAPLMDEVVQINGYTYQIKRGESVEVPESVARVLREAGRI